MGGGRDSIIHTELGDGYFTPPPTLAQEVYQQGTQPVLTGQVSTTDQGTIASVPPESAPQSPTLYGQVSTDQTGQTGDPSQVRAGSPQQPWRATYGQDVGSNYQQGGYQTTGSYDPGANQGGQPWRATYGGDVGNNYRPGSYDPPAGGTTGNGSQPWRGTYGGDVGQTYQPGQPGNGQIQQPGNGQVYVPPGYNGPIPGRQPNGQPMQPNGGGDRQVDPNANGSSTQVPQWRPTGPNPGWNAPGPAPAQPGNGGIAQPGGGAAGGDPNAGLRNQVAQSLEPHVGFYGNMVIGGVGGVLGGGPIPYLTNNLANSISLAEHAPAGSWQNRVYNWDQAHGGTVTGGAKWWQDHFDPRRWLSSDLILQKANLTDAHGQVKDIISTDQSKLANIPTTNPTPTEIAEGQRLLERQKWLDSPQWLTPKEGQLRLQQLKAEMDVAKPGSTPLFNDKELKLLQDRQVAVMKAGDLEAASKAAEASGVKGFMGGSLPEIGSNFVKGAAFVGVTEMADNYLDRVFGNDHKQGLTNTWNTNSLLLPLAFAAPNSWTSRAIWTAGALVGGKVLDKVLPAGDHAEFSQYLKPNGVDSLAMGAAFLMPTKTLGTKLALIGGAWALGRVENYFQGHGAAETQQDAHKLLADDAKQKTKGSMQDAINKFYELGSDPKKEYALRFEYEDYLRPGRQFPDLAAAYRGGVIVADAFGMARLKNGTLLPNTKTPEHILGGENIDLNAQALRAFYIARLNVDRAEQSATPDQKSGLEDVKKQIEQNISVIYGKHDINSCVTKMEDAYQNNQMPVAQMRLQIENSLTLNMQRGGVDNQFQAKLLRDLALIDIAIAQHMKSGNPQGAYIMLFGAQPGQSGNMDASAQGGFDGAVNALRKAQQLDPNNPDQAQLEAIANKLTGEIRGNVNTQMRDPKYNPLQIAPNQAVGGGN